MGRRRKHDTHLPRGMQRHHKAFYYVSGRKWIWLAPESNYGAALRAYADLVGAPVSITTISDMLAAYLEHCRSRLKPSTLESYGYSAGNLRAVFGHLGMSELQRAHVYRYLTESGTVQANRDRALLSAAYTHAKNIGAFVGEDPTKGLQYRNPEKPRQRYVTDDEMDRLVSAASPQLSCIARFIELTGMRQSDALQVRLTDIGDAGIFYIANKTGKSQIVAWSPELRECVEVAKRLWRRFGREYLFESRPKGKHAARGAGPYTTSGLRALWRKARAKAGLEDVRLHDLRRKSGSDAESDAEAQERLGHDDVKTTRRHYRAKPRLVKPTR